MLPKESILHCEQCGAPMQKGEGELSCLPCLLRGGMEADGNDAAVSPTDLGTRFYQHYEVMTRADGSAWELGRGAMGATYKAVDRNLQVPVALKVLNGRFSPHPEARQRFLREAQAAARLRHPNVASVFHFGVVNALPVGDSAGNTAVTEDEIQRGDCFYAMEFVEGETLEARLRREGPLNAREALEIAAQVTRALVAAERQGLVHGDLKPANIMLAREEGCDPAEPRVKVIDFGLAQVAAESGARPAHFFGTPEFASPEQLRGERTDIRSDIYSLGATLWYSLSGEPPKTSTRELRREIPTSLQQLLQSMLAPDPGARPASASALSWALGQSHEKLNSPDAHRRSAARWRYAAAIALAAALAALGYYISRPGPIPDDKSIAVLPFKDLSNDRSNAFLVAGLEGDVLANLVKIRDLKVISRLSVSRYSPDKPRNLPAIGRALGVRHLLEGSVRRTGDRVLVQVALIDSRNGRARWRQRYDRTIADTIRLQGELAVAISDVLDADLTAQEKVDLSTEPTRNPDAYLLYLRGRKFENSPVFAISDYEAARVLYTQALALDPGFALAHARLASTLGLLYRLRGPEEDFKTRARAEVREALRLRPGLGEAHLAKGFCFYRIERDFERAEPELEIARRLLPNDPEPEALMAYIHRRQGKWRAARAGLERVVTRDPRNMNYEEELFATACLLRDWPGAAVHIARTLSLAPTLPQVKVEEAYLAIWREGNLAPVQKAFSQIPGYGDPGGDVTWARWDAAMIARDYARAQAALDSFPFETLPSVFSAPIPKSYLEGCVKLAQGENAAAQSLLESARPQMEAEMRAHPEDGLRHSRLGLLYAYMGRRADAIREGKRAVEVQPVSVDAYDGPQRLCNLALIYARLGDNDQAIAMIESLLRKPGCVSFYEASLSLSDLRLRWQWDPLRSDRRFQKVVAGTEPTTVY